MNSIEIYDIFASDQIASDNVGVMGYDISPQVIALCQALQASMHNEFQRKFSSEES